MGEEEDAIEKKNVDVVCKQRQAGKMGGEKKLTGGCELWFKHSGPKNINGKPSPYQKIWVCSNGAIKEISASGSGKFGKAQKLVHLKTG